MILERDDGVVRATVSDDGVGVDDTVLTERPHDGHWGVLSMRDTVQLAKGRFSIAPGHPGTVVSVEVPVRTD